MRKIKITWNQVLSGAWKRCIFSRMAHLPVFPHLVLVMRSPSLNSSSVLALSYNCFITLLEKF